jgi:RNA chaperone Hfq
METNLLDRMLDTYLTGRNSVTVTLRNKIRVSGRIKAFDSYVIVMDGHKQEILYRHAVMCVSPLPQEEQKRQTVTSRPAAVKTAPPRPAKSAPRPPAQTQPQSPPPTAPEAGGLSNSMKEGLLKWMQEHKAAK